MAPVFQKEWCAKLPDEIFLAGNEGCVGLIRGNQVQVQVGMGVRFPRGVGAAEKCGHDTGVSPADRIEAFEDGAVVCGLCAGGIHWRLSLLTIPKNKTNSLTR